MEWLPKKRDRAWGHFFAIECIQCGKRDAIADMWETAEGRLFCQDCGGQTNGILLPRDHWLLDGIAESDLSTVLKAGRERRYLPARVLFREGDTSDGLYLILRGMVEISAANGAGEGVLTVAGANSVVGEMGVLDGAPRSATATARNICVTYFVPSEPFVDLLERSSVACRHLFALLVARLRRADAILVQKL